VRDEGFGKIAPKAIKAALAKAGLTAAQVDRFIMGAPMKGVNDAVAKASGIAPEKVANSLQAELGDAGTAQALILLAHALETAKAGEMLVVVGFGQGCDVLIFRATGEKAVKGLGVSGWLARKKAEGNYTRRIRSKNGAHCALSQPQSRAFLGRRALHKDRRNPISEE
jgi:3-hydroxy-3-methylglutaryl CoA synthase